MMRFLLSAPFPEQQGLKHKMERLKAKLDVNLSAPFPEQQGLKLASLLAILAITCSFSTISRTTRIETVLIRTDKALPCLNSGPINHTATCLYFSPPLPGQRIYHLRLSGWPECHRGDRIRAE